jgi:hypothetical protein
VADQQSRAIDGVVLMRRHHACALVSIAVGLALGACSIDSVHFSQQADAPVQVDAAPPGAVTLVVSATELIVGEAAQSTFTVTLSNPPQSPLLVNLTSSSDVKLGVSPSVLLFQSTDFAISRVVTVTGREDDDVANELQSVDVAAPGVGTTTVSITVNDNDVLGIITTPSTGVDVTEGGMASFAVRLNAQPTTTTMVTLVSANPLAATLTPTTLTFTTSNWNINQSVTVSGIDDANTTNDSSNVVITGFGLADVGIAIAVSDDDVLGIEPSSTNLGSLAEGTTSSFTVRLSHRPPADVTVAVLSSNVAAVAVTESSLTFTTANWDTPQTVDVTLPQDADTATTTATISLAATGLTTRFVAATVTDDDVQAITATPSPLAVAEGGNTTLDVRLAFQPAADVTVATSSLNPAVAAIVMPASLTFTPTTYAAPQTVTVAGVEDANAAPGAGTIRLESIATGIVTDVPINVTDNDTLAIEVSSTTVNLAEGGSTTFQVRLTAMPLSDVIVNVSSEDLSAATVSPSSLSFTPGNWNTLQTVTVTGAEDVDLAAESVVVTLNASGFLTLTVTATVSDNDTQQILVSSASVNVTEGGTGTVGVSLAYQPAADVTVNVVSGSAAVATVSAATLTFTTANYATVQNVTITGAQDANAANDSTTVLLTSAATTGATVAVNVTDDDVLAIETDVASVSVDEGGTATFRVRLSGQPAATTTVMLASNDASAATASPASLTFTATNFSTFQTVTVTGVEDADVTAETAAIILSATGFGNVNVGVNVTDNDTFTIVTTTAAVALSEAGTTSFGVRLSAMPASNVTVNVTSSDTGAATVAPTSLTFTTANWNSDQTVTVTGVADTDLASETVTIICSSTGLANRVVTATVNDDDIQQVLVTPTSLSVNEGSTASFGATLQFAPSGNVTVTVTSNNTSIATVSPATLSFTSANFNIPQTVTVTGVSDANASNESTTITASAPAVTSGTVNLTVLDDDTVAIATTAGTVALGEASATSFGIHLTAMPAGNVTVNVASSDTGAATVAPTSLTFTTVNWNNDQTVTVIGVADSDLANETVSITCSSNGLTNRVVTATVTDDDTQQVLVTPASLSVNEGSTASFGVTLRFIPSGNITVTVASNNTSAATVSPATLNFTPANFNTSQTVTVTGSSDANASNESTTITASTPGALSGIVSLTVVDDDTLAIVVSTTTLTVSEFGSDTFNVRLSAQPAGNTIVSISSNDVGAASISRTSLTFTTANWNTDQAVTVTAVSDDDLNHESVTITVASAPLASKQVIVAVADDDLLSVFPESLETCSFGSVDLDITLGGPPFGGPVTVSVVSGAPLTASSTSLRFAVPGTQTIILHTDFVSSTQFTSVVISGPLLTPRVVNVTIFSFCP